MPRVAKIEGEKVWNMQSINSEGYGRSLDQQITKGHWVVNKILPQHSRKTAKHLLPLKRKAACLTFPGFSGT